MVEKRNETFKLYARTVILNKAKDKVLLLKKKDSQRIGAGAWLLPGGTVEFGEDIETALIREIKEETNLTIKSLRLVTEKKMIIDGVHWLGLYYLGEVSSVNDLKNLEAQKHETVQFIPFKDIPKLRDYTVLQFVKNISSNKEYFNALACAPEDHSMENALEKRKNLFLQAGEIIEKALKHWRGV